MASFLSNLAATSLPPFHDLPYPVPHIIGSNEPPSEVDMVNIRETIRMSDVEIAQLGKDISQVEIALSQMKQQHYLLREHRKAHKALLSPVRRLPAELLADIFFMCLPESPDPNLRIPLLLGQICQRWRAIALSAGRLWSSIDLFLKMKRPDSQAAQVKSWLSRSAGCGLFIKLQYMGRLFENTHPVIDALLEHSSRWEDVELCLPVPLYQALAPAKGNLALLRRLKIRVTDAQHFVPSAMDIFAIAPQLRSVVLHVHTSQLDLPWEQLTKCTVSISIYAILELLRQAPNLVQCSLDNCIYNWQHLIHGPAPRLPITSNLVSLQLMQTTHDSDPCIFQYITLPSLRDVTVNLLDETNWTHSDFMSLLQRSGCMLERLALLRISLAFTELVELFEAISSLKILEVNWVYTVGRDGREPVPNDELLVHLTHQEESRGKLAQLLLPRLEILEISGLLHCHDQRIVNMIQSRWHQPPSFVSVLRSVTLKYRREWDREAISKLEQFADEGLHLSIEQMPIDMSPWMSI